MNKNLIETALTNALELLQSELESVCIDDLKEDYLDVISQVESALTELHQ